MRRLLWGCAAVVLCAMASGPRAAVAQGATTCDSPCRVIHLPLVGPRGAVCDSPCRLILLPLVTHATTVSQTKLPFIVEQVDSADMPAVPTANKPRVADQTYFEFQVDKPATHVPGNALPHYPDSLRTGNVEGQVIAAFIVDTLGRADLSSLKILKSTHPLFSAAVRAALPQMRFVPAEKGGVKVRQLVQEPFVFNVVRR